MLAFSLLHDSGGSGAEPPTDTSRFFGIVQGIRLDSQDFQTMQRAGVGSDRFLLIWGDVQPTKGGPYNWGPTDALIGSFAAHGIQVVPDLWRSPPWVAGPLVAPPIDRPEDLKAWQAFLKAAVARYGPDGTYWSTDYKKRYGDDAVPLPVHSWQVWNEPNLSKYFAPGPSPSRYARLLAVSHDAIRSEDPNAQIVLAGMPGYGDVNAWKFLEELYAVPGVQDDFDAASLHPYAPDVQHLQGEIERVRKVMNEHGDQATPLWITEIGWGSAPPDRFGINQGLQGQNTMLKKSFGLILSHQKDWNVRPPVLVRLEGSEQVGRRQVQLLRQRRTASLRPHPEARLPHVHVLYGRYLRPPRHPGNRWRCSTLPARWATRGEGVEDGAGRAACRSLRADRASGSIVEPVPAAAALELELRARAHRDGPDRGSVGRGDAGPRTSGRGGDRASALSGGALGPPRRPLPRDAKRHPGAAASAGDRPQDDG